MQDLFFSVFSTEIQANISSCSSPLLPVTSTQCCKDLQKEKEEVRTSLEEALKKLEEQHKEELVQLEDRCGTYLGWHSASHTWDSYNYNSWVLAHRCLDMKACAPSTVLGLIHCMFLCVCQIEEFLPNRVGQSPPDVPGGGWQMPHVDGGAGQSTHTDTL